MTLPRTLDEFPLKRFHIHCTPCARAGRYNIERAIARHGPDFPLQAFIDLVTACPRRRLPEDHPQRCGAGSDDFLRLDANVPRLNDNEGDCWRAGHRPVE